MNETLHPIRRMLRALGMSSNACKVAEACKRVGQEAERCSRWLQKSGDPIGNARIFADEEGRTTFQPLEQQGSDYILLTLTKRCVNSPFDV